MSLLVRTSERENECKTNPAGNGFHGTISQTSTGFQCMTWALVENTTLTASLPVKDITTVQNYCRRSAASQFASVTCVTNLYNRIQVELPCDVKFCGKDLCTIRYFKSMHLSPDAFDKIYKTR